MDTVETVRDAMLHHPTVHPADLTVGEARAIFGEHPRTHLLLLVTDDVLVGALTRDDVAGAAEPAEKAARLGSLQGRTVAADVPVAPLREALVGSGLRRIAVVDDGGHLLGLLCLKRSLEGFCTDAGVTAMRSARADEWLDAAD
ncbi:MAG: CBS domain-containing protein [Nocardioidaceae bacterium]|nr:CBS domain-containing protein [Nocardioidaceae bacterium]NUS51624.1 CBS domain-containing protein [Nocardioidaceae bacterium]